MIVGSEIYMECLVRTTLKKKKSSKSKSKSKSRFSDEQIRSLEVMFESDTKLEAKKKAEVATQLGLQPRQVAIWFQNKRARWKSKHLENEFKVLLNNYNTLASQFESLKKDNLSLLAQIEEMQKVKYKSSSDGESSADHDYSRSKNIIDHDDFHQVVKNNGVSLSSDDDDNDHGGTKTEFLGLMDDHDELLKMVEPHVADHDQDWGTLHLHSHDHLINQTSFQWWDFWS